MRCLYCGKELALLKRLRGGGDFCSDAHKQSYQEEYNRLALSRLLQAQKKGVAATSAPTQNAAPPPSATVALEEPVPDELSPAASVQDSQVEAVLETAVDEVAAETVSEPVMEAAMEESPAETEAADVEPIDVESTDVESTDV